eukprot:TRINITY_DN4721_c0_g1_i1.p1 TRINITY_DN4721_c0_g1~~TRINITY_DN4721_c0_g1_i1.p1  ORF type:complete len:619 (+),score=92.21 TRINITY_DN4721_c0_g1_i1:190-2046(+)
MSCDAIATPRSIAKELNILQQSFIEAHEKQVHHLVKLLASAGVQLPPAVSEKSPRGCPEARKCPAAEEERTHLDASSHLSWDDPLSWEPLEPLQEEVVAPMVTVCLHSEGQNIESSRDVQCEAVEMMNSEISGQSDATAVMVRAFSGQSDPLPVDASKSLLTDLPLVSLTPSKLRRTGVEEAVRQQARSGRRSWLDSGLNDIISSVDATLLSASLADTGRRRMSFLNVLHSCTESCYFDLACGLVIVVNSLFMAYETEWALTESVGTPTPRWMRFLGRAFTGFFVIELLLRMCGGLQRFFCTCNMWNFFDLTVVVFAVLEEVLQEMADFSNARMIRLLRLTRTIKVFRTFRLMRFVGALRTLVNSLMGTIKQVIWAFFLILCLMFVFAVIFGQVVSNARWSDPQVMEAEGMRLFWGDLSACMYTLYLSVSGGVDWVEAAQPLEDLGTTVFLSFILYVALAQWVVLNVITGCFCESAAEASRKDVGLAVQAHRCDRDKFLHRCKTIFQSIDMDGSGQIDVHDMKPFLDTEPAHALFAALEIGVDDAKELFDLLDEDGTQVIDLEEFMFGCLRLRGSAKALDVARLHYQNKHLTKKLNTVLKSRGSARPESRCEKSVVAT